MKPLAPFPFLPRHVRARTLRALLWLRRRGGEDRAAAQARIQAIRHAPADDCTDYDDDCDTMTLDQVQRCRCNPGPHDSRGACVMLRNCN